MDPDSLDSVDTSAVAASIGAELFGQSKTAVDTPTEGLGDGETVNEEVAEPVVAEVAEKPAEAKPAEAAPVDPNAPAVVPGQNSVGRQLPKSWKKDMAPAWEKLDPSVKEYVYEREANVMRGIQQYQGGYEAWNNLVSPFKPLLEANPDVNPIILMQGLMATHLQLLNPSAPAQQKIQLVQALLSEYGINLSPEQQQNAPDAALQQRLAKAEKALDDINRERQISAKQRYDEGVKEHLKVVDAFIADPKNKYFSEVANHIYQLIEKGAATTVAEAYDIACYANPTVRAKVLADQQAIPDNKSAKQRDAKTGQFVNVDGDEVKPIKPKKGSINDTIDAVVNSHYGKH